jgi:hypothetical protein
VGGLRCAKELIDQQAALERQLACTKNTILLNSTTVQPTYEELEQFQGLAESLAKCAAAIEARIRKDGGQ